MDRKFFYPIKAAENCDFISLEERIKSVKGVTKAEIRDGKLFYEIDEWASDYDVLAAATEIAEEFGAEILYGEDDEEETVGEEVSGSDETREKAEPETEEEPKKEEDKRSFKADAIENGIILGISVVLALFGAIFAKKETVSYWLYALAFVFASYGTLYDVIVSVFSKKYFFEDAAAVVSGFVLLYAGHRLSAVSIAITYSLLRFAYDIISHITSRRGEELKTQAEKEENSAYKEYLYGKARAFDSSASEIDGLVAVSEKTRIIINLTALAAGAVAAFVPPFFRISDYGTLLTDKYLPIGVAIVYFSCVGFYVKSAASALSFALSGAFKSGATVRGAKKFFALSEKRVFAFKKTGVLTEKKAKVKEVTDEKAAALLFAAEENSSHPIADAIRAYLKESAYKAVNTVEYSGLGISCEVEDKPLYCGSKKFLSEKGIALKEIKNGSPVYVVWGGEYVGAVTFSYNVQENAAGMIAELRSDSGLKTVILSGDGAGAVNALNAELKADAAIAGATAKYISNYLKKENAVYVGSSSDGELLSEAENALSADDSKTVTDAGGNLKNVPKLYKLASRAVKTVAQNRILSVAAGVISAAVAITVKLIRPDAEGIFFGAAVYSVVNAISLLNALKNGTDVV